jgi:molybdenum cofactor biosynthesis protein MoaC
VDPLRSVRSVTASRRRGSPALSPSLLRHFSSRRQSGVKTTLTHMDETGRPVMVDVTAKGMTVRTATAYGRIYIPRKAFDLIESQPVSAEEPLSPSEVKAKGKGDVLLVAQLAAIMGCKRTSELIPLCHPLAVSNVDVKLERDASTRSVSCTATVQCTGQTGVEMEALTAVSVGLLTVWDMLKAVGGQEMTIGDIKVIAKTGGKADYRRDPGL